jgi:5,10-methylenetetrahydrofolate reductase
MPKSNFNQFLDECEDFTTTAEKMSMRKISFETKPPCNDECEIRTNQTTQTNQTNQTNQTIAAGGSGCWTRVATFYPNRAVS